MSAKNLSFSFGNLTDGELFDDVLELDDFWSVDADVETIAATLVLPDVKVQTFISTSTKYFEPIDIKN